MGKESQISWTDATWNPFHGCKKISPGCKFCYMHRDKIKYGQDPSRIVRSKTNFDAPFKWKESKLIFTCSWSDWFIKEADDWRHELWEIIKATPHHTYQILTKRPERIERCLPHDWGEGYKNVWLGVSVENQKTARRCEILGTIPSETRFISAEPLLEFVDLTGVFEKYQFHWEILGGESGNNVGQYRYRTCELEWFRRMVSDARQSKVPVFIKQLGTHLSKKLELSTRHGDKIDDWPFDLRIQNFPIQVRRNK